MDDEELVNGCKSTRPDAFQRELYNKYSKQLYSVCLRYTDSADDAQDVMQDGFIRVFKNIHQYKNTGPLGGWIRRVITNVAISSLRSKLVREKPIRIEDLSINGSSSASIDYAHDSFLGTRKFRVPNENMLIEQETVTGNFEYNELLKLIQSIPVSYRTVFNMFVIDGYSHKEIGEILNIKEPTSRSQYSRACKFLRERMNIERF